MFAEIVQYVEQIQLLQRIMYLSYVSSASESMHVEKASLVTEASDLKQMYYATQCSRDTNKIQELTE